MGGVLVNGCGYQDKFRTIRYLGEHYCPTCKAVQAFNLSESKRKITIFFIPTVSINTRYAVMCAKCGNGRYISEDWKNQLLAVNGMPSMLFDNEIIEAEPSVEKLPEAPGTSVCPACQKAQPGEGMYCAFCGASMSTEPVKAPAPVVTEQASPVEVKSGTCPVCGQEAQPGEAFCGLCGTKLTD